MTMAWVNWAFSEIELFLSLAIAAVRGMSAKDLVTLALATYGALLSTFVFYQSWRKDKRRVRIVARPTFLQYDDGSFSSRLTEIEVVNLGNRPVVVNAPSFKLPNAKYMNFGDADGLRDFPKRLEDGEKASIRLTNQKIAKAVKSVEFSGKIHVRPTRTDTAGKRYLGAKWEIDTND
jgi:hypothetical protein